MITIIPKDIKEHQQFLETNGAAGKLLVLNHEVIRVNLVDCDLSYAVFVNCFIKNSTFSNCNLSNSCFDGGLLERVKITNCNLTNASFNEARLSDCELFNLDVKETNIEKSVWRCVDTNYIKHTTEQMNEIKKI